MSETKEVKEFEIEQAREFIKQPLDGALWDLGMLTEQLEKHTKPYIVMRVIEALYEKIEALRSNKTWIPLDGGQRYYKEHDVWLTVEGTDIVFQGFIDEYGEISDPDTGDTKGLYAKATHYMLMEKPEPIKWSNNK